MTVITSAGSGLLDRLAASRAATNAATDRVRTGSRGYSAFDAAAAGSATQGTSSQTRLTLGAGATATSPAYEVAGGAVVVNRTDARHARIWAQPKLQDDAIGALMSRNRDAFSYQLADQWRGLGGALLTKFAASGEAYTQTLADSMSLVGEPAGPPQLPEDQARIDAEMQAMEASRLAGVSDYASTAGLKLQTRTGQTVELKVTANAVNSIGLKVEIGSTGQLSAAERAAVAKLADGLDRALEGLGQDDATELDLSGLMAYDRSVFSSLELKARHSQPGHVDFSLRLDDSKQSMALKSQAGDLKLDVDVKTSMAGVSPAQRQSALDKALQRMEAAGDRGHANATLVTQMKTAFQFLQTPPAEDDAAPGTSGRTGGIDTSKSARDTTTSVLKRQPGQDGDPTAISARDASAGAQLSGLADFEASFGGETNRRNRFGAIKEGGHAEYQLSQKTARQDGADGGMSMQQTVSESLDASYKQAPNGGMIRVDLGQYSSTSIKDRSTVTTLIDANSERLTRVLRKTDEQQFKSFTEIDNFRPVSHREWPAQRSFVERLR